FSPDDMVTQVVTRALGGVGELVAAYQHTAALLTTALSPEDERLLAQLHELQAQLEHGDGWRLQTQVETVLTRLRLPPEARLGQLSGGWPRRGAPAPATSCEAGCVFLWWCDMLLRGLDSRRLCWH